jgi:MYXO-CTERM domain-containing protein
MTHDFSRRSSCLVRWLPILAVLLALGASPGRARADSILYVSESNNTIQSFTPGSVASTFASTGLSNPTGLAFDGSGNLYAANFGNNTIEEFTPGGVASTFASTGLNDPFGLAFDGSGNLYAANYGNNTIEKFTPGGVASTFASTGLSLPEGLAFDGSGNLYAVNAGNGTIEEFTPGGVASTFATTTAAPRFLAFGPSAVPEPPSAVLAGLGLAVVGALVAWRRRAARPAAA